MDDRNSKKSELLQIGDIVSPWNGQLTVKNIQSDVTGDTIVTFDNGMKVGYSSGIIVEVVQKQESLNLDEPGVVKKFVKKPVIIEAAQIPNDYDEAAIIQQWMTENGDEDVELVMTSDKDILVYLIITTNEGKMKGLPGDWVIKEPFADSDRKFYPCKPDIFEQTYEEVKK